MKELDSFTVERLEEWINTPEKYDPDTLHELIATNSESWPESR